MAKSKLPRNLSDNYLNQINVLRTLSKDGYTSGSPRQFQINEIAQLSGLADEKEVQRYLFILEGQKLVTPHPAGDFTSKIWQITKDGLKALRVIESSMSVAA
ncbi:MAG: hypothetical protein K1X79_13235 [Oligoflexia bacterium]|nr:hypothetical protein [Oligoflexia bacterium]